MHLYCGRFLRLVGWAVFVSSPARLLFLCRRNRAAASTRPGACAALTPRSQEERRGEDDVAAQHGRGLLELCGERRLANRGGARA